MWPVANILDSAAVDHCVFPQPPGAKVEPTLPSTLKLRTMLDAGVDVLSVVYLLYRSIMY